MSKVGEAKDDLKIGSKVIIPQDVTLRGAITIGTGSVLHPKCTIVAMGGLIVIGIHCIIEENVVIVNRSKQTMIIGDYNLFQVGCRVEAPSIGSYNTFGPKSRVSPSVSITSYCTVGAGCDLIPSPFSSTTSSARTSHGEIDMTSSIPSVTISAIDESTPPTPSNERLPEYTIVYGSESKRRLWSGEGAGQAKSLHVKHLEYLREILPKYNKLKLFV